MQQTGHETIEKIEHDSCDYQPESKCQIIVHQCSHVNMSDGEIARKIDELFDLRPKAIEDRLKLRNPIYQETAAYGHMGREPQIIVKHFKSRYEGNKDIEVELFTWEKLDYVDKVKAAFGL